MSKQEQLYQKIDELQAELLITLKQNLQLLQEKDAILKESNAIKDVIIETLDELMPDKIYGYVHQNIYESTGSAGLSKDKEAYEGSGTHIPLFKFPMSILKLREVIKKYE